MTLEELEIVIKADISDVTNKLNQLKAQLQDKVQGNVQKAVAQVRPEIESIKTSVVNTTSVASRQMDILNKQIELQARKVRKLKQEYAEEVRYARAYAESGTKNWALPDVESAKTKYQQAQIQLEKMQLRASQLGEKYREIGEKSQEAGDKVEKSMRKQRKEIEKTEKHTSKLISSLKRMIKYMIIRRTISSAIQGFRDLAVANDNFNQTMSDLQASMLQMRNSITTAFAPALETLAPIIIKIADAISWLFTEIAMWGSALAGKDTFYRAKKVTTDYAKSVDKASQSQQKLLAGFDELNVLQDKMGTNQSGVPSPEDMFEEVNIPQDVIDKATAIREKLKELLPILEAIGVVIAGYKLGQLFGLWGKGKSLVDDLTGAFRDKNSALGDQQEQYSKEYSWLKNLVPQFLSSAVSVWALNSALNGLNDNPLELPSLQPVVDYETAFETAKDSINTSMEGMKESVTKNVNESMNVLNEAIPVIDTSVSTAGDTIIDGTNRVATDIEQKNHAISRSIHDTIVANKNEIEIGTAEQVAIAESGYSDMEKDAESLSENIQNSFIEFLKATAENISRWVTNVIMPAISLMEAMNSAGDEEIFSLSGVNKAVSKVKESVKSINTNLIQPVKNKISNEIRSAQIVANVVGQNIGNWVGMGVDTGVKQGIKNVQTGMALMTPVVRNSIRTNNGRFFYVRKISTIVC